MCAAYAYIVFGNRIFAASAAAVKIYNMKESTLEGRLEREVKRLGGLALKFFIFSFTGFPDRIVLMPGARVYFVELKAPGKTPSKRQAYVHKFLNKLGFTVYVIADRDRLDNFLILISI